MTLHAVPAAWFMSGQCKPDDVSSSAQSHMCKTKGSMLCACSGMSSSMVPVLGRLIVKNTALYCHVNFREHDITIATSDLCLP